MTIHILYMRLSLNAVEKLQLVQKAVVGWLTCAGVTNMLHPYHTIGIDFPYFSENN